MKQKKDVPTHEFDEDAELSRGAPQPICKCRRPLSNARHNHIPDETTADLQAAHRARTGEKE